MPRKRGRRKRLNPAVTAYLRKIARKGGKAKGDSKRRGDSAHYAAIRKGLHPTP